MPLQTAIVGATGVLGQELLAALAELARDGEADLAPPVLCATGESAGETFPWLEDEELAVEPFSTAAVRGAAAALVAVPPAAAPGIVQKLRELGVAAVDASRAHRQTAPLFFDTRPPSLAGAPLVATPSAEAHLLARPLAALLEWEPSSVHATVLRPASAAGEAGVSELAQATGLLLNGEEPPAPRLGHRLAFNLVPQAGAFEGPDAEAERDLAWELPRLVGRELAVASTVLFGPWFYGHLATATVGFSREATADRVRERLESAPQVKVLDDPSEAVYPMPSLATGDGAVLVGRVRADPSREHGVQMVLAMDAVRATAVLAVKALLALAR